MGKICCIYIRNDNELTSVFWMMAKDMLPDSKIEQYTKSEDEARVLTEKVSKDEQLKSHLLSLSGIQLICIDDLFINLVLTTDSQHGHDWHLSMSQVVLGPDGESKIDFVPDELQERICNSFFEKWQPIENPGTMLVVDHFVGHGWQAEVIPLIPDKEIPKEA